jgi:hypothetical protein
MLSYQAASRIAQYRAERLAVAVAEWLEYEEDDLPADISNALWCERRCPASLAGHEDRLADWR